MSSAVLACHARGVALAARGARLTRRRRRPRASTRGASARLIVRRARMRPDRSTERRSRRAGTSGYAATLVVDVHHGKGETRAAERARAPSAARRPRVAQEGGLRRSRSGRRRRGARLRDAARSRAPRSRHDDARASARRAPRQSRAATCSRCRRCRSRSRARTASSRRVCTHAARDHRRGSDRERRPIRKPQAESAAAAAARGVDARSKQALISGSLGLVVGAILAMCSSRWWLRRRSRSRRRRRRVRRGRSRSRSSTKCATPACSNRRRYGEYFDRVERRVREYLGARYGFDGLESHDRRDAHRAEARAARRSRA